MRRMLRTLALIAPLSLVATLVGVAPSVAQELSCPQPDAMIKGGASDNHYLGEGIFNSTGSGQTKARRVRPGYTDRFRIMMVNDSDCTETFNVMGDGNSPGFKVRYRSGGVDVTSEVVAGTFVTKPIGYDDAQTMRVAITARRNLRDGRVKKALVTMFPTGETQAQVEDTVGAKVTVFRSAGDANSRRPLR